MDAYEQRRDSERVESRRCYTLVSEWSPELVRCIGEHGRTKDELPEMTLQIHQRYSSRPSRRAFATA